MILQKLDGRPEIVNQGRDSIRDYNILDAHRCPSSRGWHCARTFPEFSKLQMVQKRRGGLVIVVGASRQLLRHAYVCTLHMLMQAATSANQTSWQSSAIFSKRQGRTRRMRLLALWANVITELDLTVLMMLRDGMLEELMRLVGRASTHPQLLTIRGLLQVSNQM